MIKEIEGIIVKTTDYGETSRIINIYTNEGLIGVMAKGSKTVKSSFRATTLKFTYAKFSIVYKEEKLSILRSVDVINDLENIKNDIVLLSYLNYLTELTMQVVKQTQDNVYDEFIATILKINKGLDPLILCNILEIKYLDYLGVGLKLDCCVACGAKTDIVTIDGDRGGYICKNCYQNERLVKPKTMELLRLYYYVEIKSISNLKISREVKEEINHFLNTYYDRYTGLYLKSKSFLKKLQ